MRPGPPRLLILSAAIAAASMSCAGGDGPTALPRSTPRSSAGSLVDGVLAPTVGSLLYCPASQTETTAATIGPEGGVFGVAGHRVSVPAGAVPESTTFVLTAPAGRYLELDVSAMGVEHYTFLAPVTISVDFGRCPLYLGPYHVWYIDETTKSRLEDMGGVTDILSHRHTFQTSHLSGYAVAT